MKKIFKLFIMKKQFLPRTVLIISLLLVSSCFLRAQDEKLEKPEPIDNKEINQFVDESFLIYDSVYALKNNHIPSLDAEVNNLKENYAEISDPEAEKKTLQTKSEKVSKSITDFLIPKAEEMSSKGPELITEGISNVKPSFKAPKIIKGIKNNGGVGLNALKFSLKMLPDMAKQSKEMMQNIADMKFDE